MNITAHIGKKMKLDNGTAVLDIQRTFSSELDESGVVLISLQFESGLWTSSILLLSISCNSRLSSRITFKREHLS